MILEHSQFQPYRFHIVSVLFFLLRVEVVTELGLGLTGQVQKSPSSVYCFGSQSLATQGILVGYGMEITHEFASSTIYS